MAYTRIDPTPFSSIINLPIKAAGTSSLLLFKNDTSQDGPEFIGGLILRDSPSPFDLVALMDVTEIRRLARSLWDMANHLVQVRIDAEMEEQENRNKKRKRKR